MSAHQFFLVSLSHSIHCIIPPGSLAAAWHLSLIRTHIFGKTFFSRRDTLSSSLAASEAKISWRGIVVRYDVYYLIIFKSQCQASTFSQNSVMCFLWKMFRGPCHPRGGCLRFVQRFLMTWRVPLAMPSAPVLTVV